jgi:hypothetical protein
MDVQDEAPWQKAIREIVVKNWDESTRFSPLSFLGTELKKRDVAIPDGLGLLKAAQSVGGVHAIQRPGHPLVWGLHPAGISIDDDLEKYFRSSAGAPPAPLVQRFIWQAFKTEIGGDDKRVIDFAEGSFSDVSTPPQLGPDQFLIERSDQLPPSERLDKLKMYAHISAWLDSKGLKDRGLQVEPVEQAPPATSQPMPRSLLDLILDSLPERDLQKITIPADVIDRLRKIQL